MDFCHQSRALVGCIGCLVVFSVTVFCDFNLKDAFVWLIIKDIFEIFYKGFGKRFTWCARWLNVEAAFDDEILGWVTRDVIQPVEQQRVGLSIPSLLTLLHHPNWFDSSLICFAKTVSSFNEQRTKTYWGKSNCWVMMIEWFIFCFVPFWVIVSVTLFFFLVQVSYTSFTFQWNFVYPACAAAPASPREKWHRCRWSCCWSWTSDAFRPCQKNK